MALFIRVMNQICSSFTFAHLIKNAVTNNITNSYLITKPDSEMELIPGTFKKKYSK